MSNNLDPPDTDELVDHDDDFDEDDLKSFVEAYLNIVPNPTDAQMHELANLLGFDYSWFERIVFSLFSEKLDDIEEVADDPLELFLVSFFLLNPEPTDEQMHYMASVTGMSPEKIEERIYALLSEVGDLDSDSD